MEWTDAEIGKLRDLWARDVATVEIGRLLGCSKNAVVGKAHRLLLPSRPSPIRRLAPGAPRAPRRRPCSAPTDALLPALCSVVAPTVAAVPRPVRVPAPEPATDPAPIAKVARVRECGWPLWFGPKPTHHYCSAPVAGGERRSLASVYCAVHARLARRGRQPPEVGA